MLRSKRAKWLLGFFWGALAGLLFGIAVCAQVVGQAEGQETWREMSDWGEQRITGLTWYGGKLYAAGMTNRRVYEVRVNSREMSDPYMRSVSLAVPASEVIIGLWGDERNDPRTLWAWIATQTTDSSSSSNTVLRPLNITTKVWGSDVEQTGQGLSTYRVLALSMYGGQKTSWVGQGATPRGVPVVGSMSGGYQLYGGSPAGTGSIWLANDSRTAHTGWKHWSTGTPWGFVMDQVVTREGDVGSLNEMWSVGWSGQTTSSTPVMIRRCPSVESNDFTSSVAVICTGSNSSTVSEVRPWRDDVAAPHFEFVRGTSTARRGYIAGAVVRRNDTSIYYLGRYRDSSGVTRYGGLLGGAFGWNQNFQGGWPESAPLPTLNPDPTRYVQVVPDGGIYTTVSPLITRIQHVLECPVSMPSCEDEGRQARVSLEWDAVRVVSGYEVARRYGDGDGAVVHTTEGIGTRVGDIVLPADVVAHGSAGYRVRSYYFTNVDVQQDFGGRVLLVRAGSRVYSEWSPWRVVTLGRDVGVLTTEDYDPPDPQSSEASGLGNLVEGVFLPFGVPTGYIKALTWATMLGIALAAGVGFAGITWAAGQPQASIGVGTAISMVVFAVGGPLVAGMHPSVAAFPVLVLVVLGFMTFKRGAFR